MSLVMVGARVSPKALKHAALGLDLPPTVSKMGLMRAALALFHGKSHDEAYELALPIAHQPQPLTTSDRDLIDIAGKVESELAQTYGYERATAIRIGLAIARGWSREDAEEWARMTRGPKSKKAS